MNWKSSVEKAVDILLVEDNPDEIELARYGLEELHSAHQVKIVLDGAEALAFLAETNFSRRQEVPRLILLDIHTPKVNGLEVLQYLKSSPHTRHIPVVMLTNSAELGDLETSRQWKADDYLRKPVNFDHFITLLQDLVNQWLL